MALFFEKQEDLNKPFSVCGKRFFASALQNGQFGRLSGFWRPPLRVCHELRVSNGKNYFFAKRFVHNPGYVELIGSINGMRIKAVSYTHLTLPTN